MWQGAAWMWGAGFIGFALGLGVGFVLAYTILLRNKHAARLQKELDRQKAAFEDYRAKVDGHFVKTSELFQQMTEQYRAVYEHLAAGAQTLCGDRLVITKRMSAPENTPMVERKRSGTPPPETDVFAQSDSVPPSYDQPTSEPADERERAGETEAGGKQPPAGTAPPNEGAAHRGPSSDDEARPDPRH